MRNRKKQEQKNWKSNMQSMGAGSMCTQKTFRLRNKKTSCMRACLAKENAVCISVLYSAYVSVLCAYLYNAYIFWHEFGVASRKEKKFLERECRKKEKDIYKRDIHIREDIYTRVQIQKEKIYIQRERYIQSIYTSVRYIFENANMYICENKENSFNKTLKKL